MARTRYIKPEFFKDTKMAKLPRDVRLFYVGLWTEVDRNGVAEFSPEILKGSLFPFDDDITASTVLDWCKYLQSTGRVRYKYHADTWFLKINSFKKNQYFHKNEKSKYDLDAQLFENQDDLEKYGASTVQVPYKDGTSTVQVHPKAALNSNSNFNYNVNDNPKFEHPIKKQEFQYSQEYQDYEGVIKEHFDTVPIDFKTNALKILTYYENDLAVFKQDLKDIIDSSKKLKPEKQRNYVKASILRKAGVIHESRNSNQYTNAGICARP